MTEHGIKFMGMYYHSQYAREHHWPEKARSKRSWRVKVAFDPRSLNVVYLDLDGSRRMEPCTLIRGRDDTFVDVDYQELEAYLLDRKHQRANVIPDQMQARAVLRARVMDVVAKAEDRRDIATAGMRKAARLRGIRQNNATERELERQQHAWTRGTDQPISSVNPFSEDDTTYVPPADYADVLQMDEE